MIRFGGFIITYNRPKILLETIQKLFDQSHPPELLWIIDNSDNLKTDHAIAGLLDSRINYFRMGYNAGPAGAAKKGLQLCTDSGMDWILWADDNDPPFFSDTIERLLSIREVNPFCGIIGAVGHFFDRKKGVIKRIQSRLLEKKETVEVDYVAGGMTMLVNSAVIKSGVFPDEDLFFGFEELDFCLKAKRKGYAILVHCGLFLELRKLHQRTDFERPIYQKKKNPAREYYSLRNLLMISDSLTLNKMKSKLIRKWLAKSVFGFKYGFGYGYRNAKMIFLALYHYQFGIKGKTIPLG
ncbi:glycosyltransferase [Algoriphagus sp. D3-2-R+10]|uniref:glycosyltransferase n=1 Tax=Algoriphagus aurantiacus TaxID=3103948 RepID=UPI002B3D16C5|nr:glycosyltransferase [Algoriphagus sp. D3-2-R+10]MEB2778313.1 glycosyltransferase [Algoriphagus sp. D3-2-R+10]